MQSSSFTAGHALVIGIGSYQYIPRWNVPITARDAEEIAAVLRDPQLCAYIPEQVRLLTGPEATRESLLGQLDTVSGLSKVLDRLGHGDDASIGHVAAAVELVLEGMHLTRRIDKQMVEGRTVYGA